ncbi:hypothetical protein TBR22_A37810 [Luteitalea sp. TBR-22]|uniref:hypothetical protein n=1 Tax=Luteitalea sp. TBR-22 TaxID=2802971 RepID=UPI001AF26C79|nr:hypothetical protein [Luteitalea sp. TBR-22]BCS34553.1 hypothetical protein TBR22_A37810 [Luteitalea sp. TBR-22]
MTARGAGLLACLWIGATAHQVDAQSLGDVARQEAARREQIKTSGKVLTNADLPPSAVLAPAGAPAAPAPEAGSELAEAARGRESASTTDEAKAKATAAAAADTKGKAAPADDEDGWRSRAAAINGALSEARTQVRQLKALGDRLSLESQAANPDIAARASAERADLRAQVAKAEERLAEATAAHEAFQREARAAGVPSAWIQ